MAYFCGESKTNAMRTDEFIELQAEKIIKHGISRDHVRNEVIVFCFASLNGLTPIDTIIHHCMKTYAAIIEKINKHEA